MKKRTMGICFVMTSLCLLICFFTFAVGYSDKFHKAYGVFLGLNPEHMEHFNDYHIVVLEPSEFQPGDFVASLKG